MSLIHGLPKTYNDVEARFYKQKKTCRGHGDKSLIKISL